MRIAIDPNVRVGINQTYTGFGKVFGDPDQLNLGDFALAMWEETDLVTDATVIDINKADKTVSLHLDWGSFRVDEA